MGVHKNEVECAPPAGAAGDVELGGGDGVVLGEEGLRLEQLRGEDHLLLLSRHLVQVPVPGPRWMGGGALPKGGGKPPWHENMVGLPKKLIINVFFDLPDT